MALAHAEAQRTGFAYVDVEHILLGLLAEAHGIAYVVLKKNGLQLNDARTQMAKQTNEEKLDYAPKYVVRVTVQEGFDYCRVNCRPTFH